MSMPHGIDGKDRLSSRPSIAFSVAQPSGKISRNGFVLRDMRIRPAFTRQVRIGKTPPPTIQRSLTGMLFDQRPGRRPVRSHHCERMREVQIKQDCSCKPSGGCPLKQPLKAWGSGPELRSCDRSTFLLGEGFGGVFP